MRTLVWAWAPAPPCPCLGMPLLGGREGCGIYAKHYAKHMSMRPRPRQAPPIPQLQGCLLQAGSSNRPWGGKKEGALVALRGFTVIGRQGRGLGDPTARAEGSSKWRSPRISADSSVTEMSCKTSLLLATPSIHPLTRSLARSLAQQLCSVPAMSQLIIHCSRGPKAPQTKRRWSAGGAGPARKEPGDSWNKWPRETTAWGGGDAGMCVPGTAGGPGPRLPAERCRQVGEQGGALPAPCGYGGAGDPCEGKQLASGCIAGPLSYFHAVCIKKTQKAETQTCLSRDVGVCRSTEPVGAPEVGGASPGAGRVSLWACPRTAGAHPN